MSVVGSEQTEYLERRVADASEQALRDIQRLQSHLKDLEHSVKQWSQGEPAITPEPYGNAFTDAQTSTAKFAEVARINGMLS